MGGARLGAVSNAGGVIRRLPVRGVAPSGCPGSMSLLWYNPRTRAEQWLLRTPSTQWGVQAVEPYYSREASNFF